MKIQSTLLLTAVLSCIFAIPSFAQLKVAADGKVGIATTTPGRPLEVIGAVLITNGNGTNTNKQSNFQMRTYGNAGVHFNFFQASSDVSNNQVQFGGGAGSQYSATTLVFMTGATNTTLTGTERMRVNNAGQVRINPAGGSGSITHDLTLINDSAGKPGTNTWTITSDARIKQNVHPYKDGLEQLLKIDPVYFSYKPNTGYDSSKEYVGVLAQDIQKVAPYMVEEVTVRQEPGEPKLDVPEKLLTYNNGALTYMLVNAVKEQQALIEEKEQKIEDLEERLARIEQMLANGGAGVNNTNVTLEGTNGASLKQNAPNPFSENTVIEYSLPRGVQNAYIQISNAQGAVMRKVSLQATEGKGTLNIKAKELAAGEYVYTLVIDGKILDTKKMVLVNN